VLEIAFRAMGLQKHPGVIISQDLEEKIINEMEKLLPAQQYVIDTIFAVLFAADNKGLSISDNQREELRATALRCVFATQDYKDLVEETKKLTTAAVAV
jgi:hypothetical protein